jgi:hypothetical protein
VFRGRKERKEGRKQASKEGREEGVLVERLRV